MCVVLTSGSLALFCIVEKAHKTSEEKIRRFYVFSTKMVSEFNCTTRVTHTDPALTSFSDQWPETSSTAFPTFYSYWLVH